MVTLGSHLNTLNFATQLEVVRDLLMGPGVKAKVTFWGSRVVTVEGFKGSVYLNRVIDKVLTATSTIGQNMDQVTEAQRNAADEIEQKLRQFYRHTDAEVKVKNCLTRFFLWIREFSFCCPYTIRFLLEEDRITDNLRPREPIIF